MGNIKKMLEENVEDKAYDIFCSNGFFRMWDYLDLAIEEYLISAEEADQIERRVFDKYKSCE